MEARNKYEPYLHQSEWGKLLVIVTVKLRRNLNKAKLGVCEMTL